MKQASILFFLLAKTWFVCSFEPIDVVYTWVDGADLEWRRLKSYYLGQYQKNGYEGQSGVGENRFENHNELLYSLRSLYKYAPFVNHIYIVTMGQKPNWLVDHPKISIVDHTEIFPDLEHLPTFNSRAIESNLHRIPGLSERYLFCNDDFFFNQPVTQDDFYSPNGLIKEVFSVEGLARKMPKDQTSHLFSILYAHQLLDAVFGYKLRPVVAHKPHPYLKSFVQGVEKLYPDMFKKSSAEKFRGGYACNLSCAFLPIYGLETGVYIRSPLKCKQICITKDWFKKNTNFMKTLFNLDCTFFCLNDDFSPNYIISKKIKKFLATRYPDPAPWEKKEAIDELLHSDLTTGKCFQSVVE